MCIAYIYYYSLFTYKNNCLCFNTKIVRFSTYVIWPEQNAAKPTQQKVFCELVIKNTTQIQFTAATTIIYNNIYLYLNFPYFLFLFSFSKAL